MVYRIDLQHFLTHAIDHFTRDELLQIQYAIISSKIPYSGGASNAAKFNELYPTIEIVDMYANTSDKEFLRSGLFRLYDEICEDNPGMFYKTFINTMVNHVDVAILCDACENDYVDILCEYLKTKFHIDVIDLNELFTKGRTGAIYLDRNKIWDKAVDIRRRAGIDLIRQKESSRDGRMHLLRTFSDKQKRQKLKELGIYVRKSEKDLDQLLMDAWVNDEEGD